MRRADLALNIYLDIAVGIFVVVLAKIQQEFPHPRVERVKDLIIDVRRVVERHGSNFLNLSVPYLR